MQTIYIRVVLLWVVLLLLPVNLAAADPDCQDLIEQLTEPNWRVRYLACKELGKSCTTDPNVPPALAQMLEDGDTLVRYAAAWALEQFGPVAEGTELNLVRVLDQDYVGKAASKALQHLGSSSLTPLVQVVLDENEPNSMRIAALGVLAEFGPDANGVLEDLIGLLDPNLPSRDMTIAVCHAVGEQGGYAGQNATAVLLELCNSNDSLIRLEAARTLGKIGPLDVNDVNHFVEKLENEQETLNQISQGLIDADRQPVEPDPPSWKIGGAEHRCIRVQIEMVNSLKKLQSQQCWSDANSIIMPALVNVLNDNHTSPLFDLWHVQRPNRTLYCPCCNLYAATARALSFFGPAAKIALPRLQELRDQGDMSADQRNQVINAISRIELYYIEPFVFPADCNEANTTLYVMDEKLLSVDKEHINVTLRIRKNSLTRDELRLIFPNNAAHGRQLVYMGEQAYWWGEPEDQPIASRLAKIPAEEVEPGVWAAHLTIPRIEYSALYVWGTGGGDFSGLIWPVLLIWSDAGCVE